METSDTTRADNTTATTGNRRTRAATVLMVPALAALAVSAVLFLLPVTNPGVQDCGAPARFLLGAKSNRALVEADGTAINGWDQKRLHQAYENRCSVRVAQRAVPAGILLAVFWVLALVGWITGWIGRRALKRGIRTRS